MVRLAILFDNAFLLMNRNDREIADRMFQAMNTIHGSALYTESVESKTVEVNDTDIASQNAQQSMLYHRSNINRW